MSPVASDAYIEPSNEYFWYVASVGASCWEALLLLCVLYSR